MGWCHEFGTTITPTCDHPMVAGATSCTCEFCGTTCTGKFVACAEVWARGPREITLVRPPAAVREPARRTNAAPPKAAKTQENQAAQRRNARAAKAGPGSLKNAPPDVRKWLDTAFAGVREEISDIASAVEHQAQVLAGLVETAQSAEPVASQAAASLNRLSESVTAAVAAQNAETVHLTARMKELRNAIAVLEEDSATDVVAPSPSPSAAKPAPPTRAKPTPSSPRRPARATAVSAKPAEAADGAGRLATASTASSAAKGAPGKPAAPRRAAAKRATKPSS
jgi:hypothetical protein